MQKSKNANEARFKDSPITSFRFQHSRLGLVDLSVNPSNMEEFTNKENQNIYEIILDEEMPWEEILEKYRLEDDDVSLGEVSVQKQGVSKRTERTGRLEYILVHPLEKVNAQGIKLYNPGLQFSVR